MTIMKSELRKIIKEEISKIKNDKLINWIRPNLLSEYDEFERVVEEGYLDKYIYGNFEHKLQKLIETANDGKLIKLNLEDSRWRNLENGDSGQDLTLQDVFEAGELYGRDVQRILDGIKNGDAIPAAIMLELPNGSLHNIAGNTRLMICRALKISPVVWWVSMKNIK